VAQLLPASNLISCAGLGRQAIGLGHFHLNVSLLSKSAGGPAKGQTPSSCFSCEVPSRSSTSPETSSSLFLSTPSSRVSDMVQRDWASSAMLTSTHRGRRCCDDWLQESYLPCKEGLLTG
jgi:hypothetical protein